MTATLPDEVQQVFSRFVTTEFTTVDRKGQPITWPVIPFYSPGGPCIDVTTGLGYPKKARDAAANSKVALLFSDPTGSELSQSPMVLVQGIAEVDDRDLEANLDRYDRELGEKLPNAGGFDPPKFVKERMGWYYKRIYVKVRPERVYVWPDGDATSEPRLLDSHLEEVRSGHDEEPDDFRAGPEATAPAWDPRIDELGQRYESAVLSLVAPDGFPFSVRVPISVDQSARKVRIGANALGVPAQPGLACLCAHDHDAKFSWQRNFHVRGDLVEDDQGWAVVPHKLVGGFELPPESFLGRLKLNAGKMRRFRKVAKAEEQRRGRQRG
ncbi:MAG: pyridoxamine 5'-phosphate oxidase family protein [Thermoleophilaceae bacterium]